MPHPIDVQVGNRIRQRRWLIDMSQRKLGEIVGINYQQIQKYAIAENRVSASLLWEIAAAQSVPISFYFVELSKEDKVALPMMQNLPPEIDNCKVALKLARRYNAIPKTHRRAFFY